MECATPIVSTCRIEPISSKYMFQAAIYHRCPDGANFEFGVSMKRATHAGWVNTAAVMCRSYTGLHRPFKQLGSLLYVA